MTRTQIAFDDIKINDEVEREIRHRNGRVAIDRITVVKKESNFAWYDHEYALTSSGGNLWFLINRPEPVVILPKTPTLGWATGEWSGPTRLAVWVRDGRSLLRPVDSDGQKLPSNVPNITAFIPATAVPTEALDALRRLDLSNWLSNEPTDIAIRAFLAAVDADQ